MHDNPLRTIPAVHDVLREPPVAAGVAMHGREQVVAWVRRAIERVRSELTSGATGPGDATAVLRRVVAIVAEDARAAESTRLDRVLNATGVVLHTGLGRAPLSADARRSLAACSGGCNLEFDLDSGERRERGHQVLPALRALTGCEDALVVNNNAAATLLTLQALCSGREVVLSRGQLIEIGGSFRLPEIFELSGATLREVGTTNRTRLADYERAIGPQTAAVLRVHPSNYRIVGFTETPEIEGLAELARRSNLVLIDDIGSGPLIDMTPFGLAAEPTFARSLAAGADVVLGSGDKLLGGPQAGLILGRGPLIDRLRRHPLARAVRVGKLTLAALAATLGSYLRGTAKQDVPAVALLAASADELRRRAASIAASLGEASTLKVTIRQDAAPVGGGAAPGSELPTVVIALRHPTVAAADLARRLRTGRVRVVPRIHDDEVWIDLRSVPTEDDPLIATAVRECVFRIVDGDSRFPSPASKMQGILRTNCEGSHDPGA